MKRMSELRQTTEDITCNIILILILMLILTLIPILMLILTLILVLMLILNLILTLILILNLIATLIKKKRRDHRDGRQITLQGKKGKRKDEIR